MSKTEQFEYRIISDFILGKIKRSEASLLLTKTERSVSRIARRIQREGFMGVKHGNTGKSPVNKTSTDLKQNIIQLIETKYFDFNITHCLEKLKLDEKIQSIKYSTLRRWCHEKNIVKRRHRRRSKVRKLRVRMPCEGLLLQMDGSHHRWNRRDEWCLIAAIDDATSKIPYAEFFLSEDTLNCMVVMQKIIEKNGIPEVMYVDKAGCLGGGKRALFNQFKRACEELGIRIIFANSAEAKGRIERTWDTFQDRLIPELRLRNIQTMPRANEYLQNEFIPNYWMLNNTVSARDPVIKYRPLSEGINLREIFCIKEYRTVKADHTFSYESELFAITGELKYSIRQQQIEIRIYQDLKTEFYFAGKKIQVELVRKEEFKVAA